MAHPSPSDKPGKLVPYEDVVRGANQRAMVLVTQRGLEELLEIASRARSIERRHVLATVWLEQADLSFRTRLRLRPLVRILRGK